MCGQHAEMSNIRAGSRCKLTPRFKKLSSKWNLQCTTMCVMNCQEAVSYIVTHKNLETIN